MRLSTIVLATMLITLGAGVRASTTNISQSGQKFSEKSIDLKAGDTLNFQKSGRRKPQHHGRERPGRSGRSGFAETRRDRQICFRQGRTLQDPLQYSSKHEDERNGEVTLLPAALLDRNS